MVGLRLVFVLCEEEETLDILSARDLLMEGSDPSDSDSTLMASIPRDPESTVSLSDLETKIHLKYE